MQHTRWQTTVGWGNGAGTWMSHTPSHQTSLALTSSWTRLYPYRPPTLRSSWTLQVASIVTLRPYRFANGSSLSGWHCQLTSANGVVYHMQSADVTNCMHGVIVNHYCDTHSTPLSLFSEQRSAISDLLIIPTVAHAVHVPHPPRSRFILSAHPSNTYDRKERGGSST